MKAKTKQPKLTVIYADAEEKYVKNVVLYSNAAGEVFYDEQLTQKVNGKDLQNLYLKGLVVYNTEAQQYLTPTQFTVNGEEGTISFGAPAAGGSGGAPSTTRIYVLTDNVNGVVDVNEDNTIGVMRVYGGSGNYNNTSISDLGEAFMHDFYDPKVRCLVVKGGVDFTGSGRSPEKCKNDISGYWEEYLEGGSDKLYEPSSAYFYTDGMTDGYYSVLDYVTEDSINQQLGVQQHIDGFKSNYYITENDPVEY